MDQRIGIFLINFVPQIADVYIYDIRIVVKVIIPDMVGNLASGKRLSLIAENIF